MEEDTGTSPVKSWKLPNSSTNAVRQSDVPLSGLLHMARRNQHNHDPLGDISASACIIYCLFGHFRPTDVGQPFQLHVFADQPSTDSPAEVPKSTNPVAESCA